MRNHPNQFFDIGDKVQVNTICKDWMLDDEINRASVLTVIDWEYPDNIVFPIYSFKETTRRLNGLFLKTYQDNNE